MQLGVEPEIEFVIVANCEYNEPGKATERRWQRSVKLVRRQT